MLYRELAIVMSVIILSYSSVDGMKRKDDNAFEIVEYGYSSKNSRFVGGQLCSEPGYNFRSIYLDRYETHQKRHYDPSAVPCRQCCFIAQNDSSLLIHMTKVHLRHRYRKGYEDKTFHHISTDQLDNEHNTRSKSIVTFASPKQFQVCGYCGVQGSDLTRHNDVYHRPRFGKRSYNQCFPLT